MEALFQDILSYLLLYKYLALFLVTFLAAFALPLPSTTSIMTAAVFASQGYMNIWLVILVAVLGNVLADNLTYYIAHRWGSSLFEKLGFRVSASPLFHMVTRLLQRHSHWVIFWTRFEFIAALTVNILSGMTRSSYRKFFWYGFWGETAQVLVFAGSAYFFGDSLDALIDFFGEFTTVFVIALVVGLYFSRRYLTRYVLAQQQDTV